MKTLDSGVEVRLVSDQHPRWQAVAWVCHEAYDGGVLWVKGPRRFTKDGAKNDLRRVAMALGQEQKRRRRARA